MHIFRRPLDGNVLYESLWLLTMYFIATVAKIYFQIHFNSIYQAFFLILSNYLLIYPFLKDFFYVSKFKVIMYFVLINLGEMLIISYENLFFLKTATFFYLSSKFALIIIFKNLTNDYRLSSIMDFVKILGPQFLSFLLGYLIYNNANLDISMSILIIIYAVVQAFIFSYIFYFKTFTGVGLVRLGLLFLSVHDIFGGYNIFNQNIDSGFVISFSLISIGNFLLGFGIWRSRLTTT